MKKTGYEYVTGKTPDIFEIIDFNFHDLDQVLGIQLDVPHPIVSDMGYWIMGESGIPIAETTVQHMTQDETMDPIIANQIKTLNKSLTSTLDNTNFKISRVNNGFKNIYKDLAQWDEAYWDNAPPDSEYDETTIPLAEAQENIDPNILDKYIEAKIVLDD